MNWKKQNQKNKDAKFTSSYTMAHSFTAYTHTHASGLWCQLADQLKSSCSNKCSVDHINTTIDFVWGGLHESWIAQYIMNGITRRLISHTHTPTHTSGAVMIHLSKHSQGSVRSGSQRADRCLSFYIWPDKTYTNKVDPDFVLEQSTQRLNEAALYCCMSDRAFICVCVFGCVCVWVALTVYLSAYQTPYCQFLFVVWYLWFGRLDQSAHRRQSCLLFAYCLSVVLSSLSDWTPDWLIAWNLSFYKWTKKEKSNSKDECGSSEWMNDSLSGRQTRRPTDCQAEWQKSWHNNKLGEWLTARLMRCLTEWITAA